MNNDQEIIDRFLGGDKNAFDELVRRHQHDVHMLALRILRNPDDALDVSQQVFMKVHRSLKKFRGDSIFTTWLYRITYNQCMRHLDGGKWKRMLSIDEAIISRPAEMDPGRDAERNEFRRDLELAINGLPAQQRAVFAMHNLQELKLREIAEIMNRKIGTIKALHFQAVRKLREALKDWKYAGFAA